MCIGTWPYLHAPVTIAALEAGKHVLCEARMAMNASQAHAMLEAARANPHLTAQIVPAPHTLALDRTIVEMIGDGYIGDLVAVDAHVTLGSGFPRGTPPHWRHDRDLSGNNIMMMGIWYEAMMRWVGPASTVTALAQRVVRHRDRRRAAAAWRWRSRTTSTCSAAWPRAGRCGARSRPSRGLAPPTSVAIYGTEGTLKIAEAAVPAESPFALWGGRRRNKRLRRIAIAPEKAGGWRVEEEFVNAVRGREPVTHTDFVTAVKYMEWTDAVSLSARTGETVRLPLFD